MSRSVENTLVEQLFRNLNVTLTIQMARLSLQKQTGMGMPKPLLTKLGLWAPRLLAIMTSSSLYWVILTVMSRPPATCYNTYSHNKSLFQSALPYTKDIMLRLRNISHFHVSCSRLQQNQSRYLLQWTYGSHIIHKSSLNELLFTLFGFLLKEFVQSLKWGLLIS